MTTEEALKCMTEIERTFDGTEWSKTRIRYLTKVLIERPDDFAEEFIDTANMSEKLRESLELMRKLPPNPTPADLVKLAEGQQPKAAE